MQRIIALSIRLARWAAVALLAVCALAGASLMAMMALPSQAGEPQIAPPRQAALRNLLTQDCGSCHGLRLTGGLGPPLVAPALDPKPVEFLAYTIHFGRPGTAMPPWNGLLSEAESMWLARELKGQN